MEFLSVLSKGSQQDKISWAFTFYDLDRDGVISREEMMKVTDAIHELMGGEGGGGTSPLIKQHVNRIFDSMDTNNDGFIDKDEFHEYCSSQTTVRESMSFLP